MSGTRAVGDPHEPGKRLDRIILSHRPISTDLTHRYSPIYVVIL